MKAGGGYSGKRLERTGRCVRASFAVAFWKCPMRRFPPVPPTVEAKMSAAVRPLAMIRARSSLPSELTTSKPRVFAQPGVAGGARGPRSLWWTPLDRLPPPGLWIWTFVGGKGTALSSLRTRGRPAHVIFSFTGLGSRIWPGFAFEF